MTLFLKYWKKQPLHPLSHLHSHHLGAHGLRLFIHLHYIICTIIMQLWHQIVVRTNSMPQATDKWHDWCSYLVLKSSLGYQRTHGRPNGLWKLFMADNVICTSYNYLPVISVMLVGAKYLRVGNCLFLCVQGWGREHKVKKNIYIYLQIPGGYLAAVIDPYIKFK